MIEDIVLEYPDAPWDWRLLSSKVKFDFILANSHLPWNYHYVSMNKHISDEDVINHPEINWSYDALCGNPSITFDFINRTIIKECALHRVDWASLSANPTVTMIDIIKYSDYKWNHRYLSSNPNLTSNFILNEGSDFDWYVPLVSSNRGITSKDILKSTLKSKFDWDYKNLSANPNLPTSYVAENIYKPWNFFSISTNASITDIQNFHQIQWDSLGLSMNKSITMDFVLSHPHIEWNWYALLSTIDLDAIMQHKSLFQKNVTEPIAKYICLNKSITLDFIKKNIHEVDWKKLSHIE